MTLRPSNRTITRAQCFFQSWNITASPECKEMRPGHRVASKFLVSSSKAFWNHEPLESSQWAVTSLEWWCRLGYIYIYMVAPPHTYPFCTFTGIYGVFLAYFGVYICLTFFQINLDIVSRGRTIYIYNRGCRQTCETWWFWHQEVLGGPRTSLEPRTKIAQKVLEESWFLVLGSKEVLGPLSSSSFQTMS